MIGTTDEIFNYLYDKKADDVFEIKKKEKKSLRSLAQNNFFYWLFSEIWNHLWESKEDVKKYFMIWCFWIKEIEMFWVKQQIPIKNTTKELKKEEAIFLINTLWKFVWTHNIPCKYTPREVESLLNSEF